MSEEQTPMAPKDDTEVEKNPETQAPKETEKPDTHPGAEQSRWHRFKNWYLDNKKWTIALTILVVLLLLFAIPFTRYNIAGLFLKGDISVQVADSTASTNVSGATLSLGGQTAQTDSAGFATLHHVKVGHHKVTISKKYYQDRTVDTLVPLFGRSKGEFVELTATGRQVKITVTNLINKNPLENVNIKVAGTTAKTDKSGSAVVVLPAGTTQQKAELSLDGFNDATVTVNVSGNKVQDNPFTLTPAGKVYFLSKLSGKIDVVKTNLDGTARTTVLAGTGKEDDQNTVLLASRDWKHLALLSRRAGSSASLYLINTADDSLSTIDEGDVTFQLLGWSDNYFSYVINRNNIPTWKARAQSIKSFNAQSKQLLTLDSTNATGANEYNATYESYIVNPVLLDNLIVYEKTWDKYPGYSQVTGQSNTLSIIRPDGTGKKLVKSLDSAQAYFSNVVFHTPSSVYVQVSNSDYTTSTYYELNQNAVLSQKASLSFEDLYKTYPTYLFSPSDKSTFWTEPRDGKNSLFVGDDNGLNGKQIASLSDYSPYGWYTDGYLLVSKNSSELYIMPAGGSKNPIKVSDYHKPVQTFNGYGGGYGGI